MSTGVPLTKVSVILGCLKGDVLSPPSMARLKHVLLVLIGHTQLSSNLCSTRQGAHIKRVSGIQRLAQLVGHIVGHIMLTTTNLSAQWYELCTLRAQTPFWYLS
jgi:hypothetical protein